jgi:PPOX class probable F420-dependent enzyme
LSWGDRWAHAMNSFYDRLRDPAAFRVAAGDATTGSFDALRDHKYGLVVTFRQNGQAVPSPVWMAVDEKGRMFFVTEADSAKVKRILRNADVLVAASNARGRPKGPVLRGSARLLARDEWEHAEATLASAFGIGRKVYERAFPMGSEKKAYVEVVGLL